MSGPDGVRDVGEAYEALSARRYRVYPEYKDSGVEWLGEVPEHWSIKRLKRLCKSVSGSTPAKDNGEYWGGDIPWVSPKDMRHRLITQTEDHVTSLAVREVLGKIMPPNVVLLVVRSGILRHSLPVAITSCPVTINQDMRALITGKNTLSSYLFWTIEGNQKSLLDLWTKPGTTVESIESEYLMNGLMPLPPTTEQQAIADFLNYRSNKIDDLIAAKRELLALLKEKRQAVITHAVTKGLDPNVKFKPSGIDWLGDVPEYWKVSPIRYCLKSKGGAIKTGPFGSQLPSADMNGDAIKIYNQKTVLSRDFQSGDFFISEEKYADMKNFTVFPGDLLLTTRGTIGRCVLTPKNVAIGILHPCLMRIQVDSRKINPSYLELLIQDSNLVIGQLKTMSNATTIDVIYSESLKRVLLLLPPLEEQEKIISFTNKKTEKIKNLMNTIEIAIEKLNEHRNSLISAAVTGKIDVRGYAP